MRARAGLLALLLVLVAGPVFAHGLAPARMELEEADNGHFRVFLKIPGVGESIREAPLEPVWPAHCVPSRPQVQSAADHVAMAFGLDCGAQGLSGQRIGLQGLAARQIDAFVQVTRADGDVVQQVLRGADPSFVLPPALTVAQAATAGLKAALWGAADPLWLALAVLLGAQLLGRPRARAAAWVAAGATLGLTLPGQPGPALLVATLGVAGLGRLRNARAPWLGLCALFLVRAAPAVALPPEHLRVGQVTAAATMLAVLLTAVALGRRWPRLATLSPGPTFTPKHLRARIY